MTDPSVRPSRPRVLYVLGRGRSGSTIFARTLEAMAGAFSAGELRTLWDPILVHNSPCACGEPVAGCPVWSAVLERVADVDRDEVARWQREVVSETRLWRLRRPGAAADWPALAGYRRVMARVYDAIVEVTGCQTVIDSSKRPSYALVVRDMPGVDSFFVHLVRDPRASAYSWAVREHEGAAGTPVPRRGAVAATVRWDLLNLGAEVVLRTVGPLRGLRLRYEDFASAPRQAVEVVGALVGAGSEAVDGFVDEWTVRLPTGHAVGGNPSRRSAGLVTIREDAGWSRSQPQVDRWLASVVALPLLRRYHYPVRPRGPVDEPRG